MYTSLCRFNDACVTLSKLITFLGQYAFRHVYDVSTRVSFPHTPYAVAVPAAVIPPRRPAPPPPPDRFQLSNRDVRGATVFGVLFELTSGTNTSECSRTDGPNRVGARDTGSEDSPARGAGGRRVVPGPDAVRLLHSSRAPFGTVVAVTELENNVSRTTATEYIHYASSARRSRLHGRYHTPTVVHPTTARGRNTFDFHCTVSR